MDARTPEKATHAATHSPPRRDRRPGRAVAGACVLVLATAGLILHDDRYATGLFAIATSGALLALLVALFARAFAAALFVFGLVVAIMAGASLKLSASGFLLHAWDLFDPSAMGGSRLATAALEAPLVAVTLGCAALAMIIAPLAGLRETANVSRTMAIAALLVCSGAAAILAAAAGEPRQTQFTWSDRRVASFYQSWPQAIDALRNGLMQAAPPPATDPPFARSAACEPQTRPPHIILIHQESVTPPGALQGVSYDPSLDDFFRSHDGRARALRVETYGGASWLTEFAIMTGLAPRFFGAMRNFVQVYMAGRVDDTLPQALARCGYRNVVFYPYLRTFFGSGRFFESIGLADFRDAQTQKAATDSEPDAFYYGNMLAEIERHVGSSQAPLFIYLQTMTAHWPYDVVARPEVAVPGGGPGVHPELNEFLRRLAFARADYRDMRAQLARRFPDERFLIVHYGDHQPLATRFLFGFDAEEIEEINSALPEDSPAFLTYFAIDALGYQPPPARFPDPLDAAYLGVVLLKQAGLPAPDSWRERARLMQACAGAYGLCADRDAILRFHRRLIDSSLVRPP
jgi:hypothetical protein